MPEMLARIVELKYGTRTFHVVPSHVVYLEDAEHNTKIHLTTGDTIIVEGTLNEIGLKLQGRKT